MAKQPVLDRYLYAATKSLPHKLRADVDAELRTLIDDMLEERTMGAHPTEADILAVLEELGPPQALGLSYSPDKEQALISQPYYTSYKMVLQIVLTVIACVFGVGFLASFFFNSGATASTGFFPYLAEWVGIAAQGLIAAFACVTLVFYILQRTGTKIEYTSLNDLPEVPDRKQTIGVAEPLFGIIFTVIIMLVLLFIPGLIGIYEKTGNGYAMTIPFFDLALLQQMTFWVVAIFLLPVALECFKLIEGRHSLTLAIATLILQGASCVCVAILFWNTGLINSEFLTYLDVLTKNVATPLWMNLGQFIVGITVLSAVCETASAFWRAFHPAATIEGLGQ